MAPGSAGSLRCTFLWRFGCLPLQCHLQALIKKRHGGLALRENQEIQAATVCLPCPSLPFPSLPSPSLTAQIRPH